MSATDERNQSRDGAQTHGVGSRRDAGMRLRRQEKFEQNRWQGAVSLDDFESRAARYAKLGRSFSSVPDPRKQHLPVR
jgi:hypothetical protein